MSLYRAVLGRLWHLPEVAGAWIEAVIIKYCLSGGTCTNSFSLLNEDIKSMTTAKKTCVLPMKMLHKTATLPTKGSAGAAGYNLYVAEDSVIGARQQGLVDTKLAMKLPRGTYRRIAPRSGLAVKGIDVAVGVIDADYHRSVKVLLVNLLDEKFQIKQGEKVAQLIVEKIKEVKLKITKDLEKMT